MIEKGQHNVINDKFLMKYFYQYFQMLSIFTYYKSLMMKFPDSANTFWGDTEDFEDARLILISPACK